jgi:hypothetical protein
VLPISQLINQYFPINFKNYLFLINEPKIQFLLFSLGNEKVIKVKPTKISMATLKMIENQQEKSFRKNRRNINTQHTRNAKNISYEYMRFTSLMFSILYNTKTLLSLAYIRFRENFFSLCTTTVIDQQIIQAI